MFLFYFSLPVILAVLPIYVLMNYVNGKDKDKEPKELLNKLFNRGCLAIIPAIILELVLGRYFPPEGNNSFAETFINCFISIGLVEEICKFLPAFLLTRKSPEFNHRYDAIVYCVYSTLGFALVENIGYGMGGSLGTGILRAILAVPSHACDAVIMGYFYGLYKEAKGKNSETSNIYLVLTIVVPALEHALYDGIILAMNIHGLAEELATKYFFCYIALVVITYIICIIILRKISKIETNIDGASINQELVVNNMVNPSIVNNTSSEVRYCTYCGAPGVGNYCAYCGKKKE